jgi:hypothetical protein
VALTSVRLSNQLTARWAAAVAEGQTTAVSGAAVWPLLAYLAAAADGQGRAELETAVELDGTHAQQAAGELLAALGRSPAVRSAIGIWAARQVEPSDWWRRTLPAGAWGRLTGDPAADKATLDAWVRDRTGGLIQHAADHLDPELQLLLGAVMGVQTTWEQPLEPSMLMPTTGPWAGRRLAGLYRVRDDRDERSWWPTPRPARSRCWPSTGSTTSWSTLRSARPIGPPRTCWSPPSTRSAAAIPAGRAQRCARGTRHPA